MTQTDQSAKQNSDQIYDKNLKKGLTDIIDDLVLDDFKKRVLKARWLDQVEWLGKRSGETA